MNERDNSNNKDSGSKRGNPPDNSGSGNEVDESLIELATAMRDGKSTGPDGEVRTPIYQNRYGERRIHPAVNVTGQTSFKSNSNEPTVRSGKEDAETEVNPDSSAESFETTKPDELGKADYLNEPTQTQQNQGTTATEDAGSQQRDSTPDSNRDMTKPIQSVEGVTPNLTKHNGEVEEPKIESREITPNDATQTQDENTTDNRHVHDATKTDTSYVVSETSNRSTFPTDTRTVVNSPQDDSKTDSQSLPKRFPEPKPPFFRESAKPPPNVPSDGVANELVSEQKNQNDKPNHSDDVEISDGKRGAETGTQLPFLGLDQGTSEKFDNSENNASISRPANWSKKVNSPGPDAIRYLEKEKVSPKRGITIATFGVIILILFGGGLYAYNFLVTADSSDEIPIILADKSPFKVFPNEDGSIGVNEPTNGKIIFDRVGGIDSDNEGNLIVPDETEIAILPSSSSNNVLDENSGEVATRQVRTVVLRPDGTVIEGENKIDQSADETSPLEIENNSESSVPSNESRIESQNESEIVAEPAIKPEPTTETRVENEEVSGEQIIAEVQNILNIQPDENGDQINEIEEPSNSVETNVNVAAEESPVPRTAPQVSLENADQSESGVTQTNQLSNGADDQIQTNELTPSVAFNIEDLVVPKSKPTESERQSNLEVAASFLPGNAFVQFLASRDRSEAEAKRLELTENFPQYFQNAQLIVQPIELGNGTWYRVRFVSGSIQSANTLCSEMRNLFDVDCFTTSSAN